MVIFRKASNLVFWILIFSGCVSFELVEDRIQGGDKHRNVTYAPDEDGYLGPTPADIKDYCPSGWHRLLVEDTLITWVTRIVTFKTINEQKITATCLSELKKN